MNSYICLSSYQAAEGNHVIHIFSNVSNHTQRRCSADESCLLPIFLLFYNTYWSHCLKWTSIQAQENFIMGTCNALYHFHVFQLIRHPRLAKPWPLLNFFKDPTYTKQNEHLTSSLMLLPKQLYWGSQSRLSHCFVTPCNFLIQRSLSISLCWITARNIIKCWRGNLSYVMTDLND